MVKFSGVWGLGGSRPAWLEDDEFMSFLAEVAEGVQPVLVSQAADGATVTVRRLSDVLDAAREVLEVEPVEPVKRSVWRRHSGQR